MKKICLLGMSLVTALATMAQADVVKDVEHMLKGSDPDYAKVMQAIQPALSNPSTANTVMPWYLAGKASIGEFNDVLKKIQTGQEVTPQQKKDASIALVKGFDYYLKALPLDSLPNEKGKIKPKKSKEMLNSIKMNHYNLRFAADFLYEAQDFDNAYRALDMYLAAPQMAVLGDNAPTADPDTIRGALMLYETQVMLLGAYQHPDTVKVKKAIEILDKIPATGYEDEKVYSFGVAAGELIGDAPTRIKFAKAGYDKYGSTNVEFAKILINDRLENEDYAGALELAESADNSVPADNKTLHAQMANVKGLILARNGDYSSAKKSYEKALELDPEFYEAMHKLGLVILADIEKQMNENETLTYQNFKDEALRAADLLEKAYNHDEIAFSGVPYNLYSVYYNLGPDYVEKSKYWEQLK